MPVLTLCLLFAVCACSTARTDTAETPVQSQVRSFDWILSNTTSDSFYCTIGDVSVYRHGLDSLVTVRGKIRGRLLFMTSKGVTYLHSEAAPREPTGDVPERWVTTGYIDQPLVEVLPNNPRECLSWAGVEISGSVKSDGLTALKTLAKGELVTVVSALDSVSSVKVQDGKNEVYLQLLVGPLADEHHGSAFTKEMLSLSDAHVVSVSEYLELSEAER